MMKSLTTPRGTIKLAAEFSSLENANDAGYNIYFTHYETIDGIEHQFEIMTKPIEGKIHCTRFAIVEAY